MAKRIKTKRPCCDSVPRCRRCPVVLRRLQQAGKAERTGKRSYVVRNASKREVKAARAR